MWDPTGAEPRLPGMLISCGCLERERTCGVIRPKRQSCLPSRGISCGVLLPRWSSKLTALLVLVNGQHSAFKCGHCGHQNAEVHKALHLFFKDKGCKAYQLVYYFGGGLGRKTTCFAITIRATHIFTWKRAFMWCPSTFVANKFLSQFWLYHIVLGMGNDISPSLLLSVKFIRV